MSYNFQLFFIHKIQCNTKTIKICLQRFSVFCLKIFEHFPHFFFTPYKYFFFHFTQENKHILLIIFVNLEKNIGQGKKKTLKLLYIRLRFKIISQVTASIILIFKGVYSRFLLRHHIILREL